MISSYQALQKPDNIHLNQVCRSRRGDCRNSVFQFWCCAARVADTRLHGLMILLAFWLDLLMNPPAFLNCLANLLFFHLPPACSSSAKCPVFIFFKFLLQGQYIDVMICDYTIFYERVIFHLVAGSLHLRSAFRDFIQNTEICMIRCCIAHKYHNTISEWHYVIISPWNSFKIM